MSWTIQTLIQWSTDYFSQKEIPTPRLDAELLLSHLLKLNRVQLYTQFDRPVSEEELKKFKILLQRRAGREPLAYILGEKEFFSLKILVSPAVLIPRPETEELVERGVAHLKKNSDRDIKILDLATGSGCLLLALLHALPSAEGIGVDISGEALEVAAANARHHGLEPRVRWVRQDLSQEWSPELAGPFDLITANLPYVSEAEYNNLQPEILRYEPKTALVPGPQGTEAFRWVLPCLTGRLKSGGLALLEIGEEQGEAVLDLVKKFIPKLSAQMLRDLAGKDRVISISLL
jgi:release factor glutamine methyltransferase